MSSSPETKTADTQDEELHLPVTTTTPVQTEATETESSSQASPPPAATAVESEPACLDSPPEVGPPVLPLLDRKNTVCENCYCTLTADDYFVSEAARRSIQLLVSGHDMAWSSLSSSRSFGLRERNRRATVVSLGEQYCQKCDTKFVSQRCFDAHMLKHVRNSHSVVRLQRLPLALKRCGDCNTLRVEVACLSDLKGSTTSFASTISSLLAGGSHPSVPVMTPRKRSPAKRKAGVVEATPVAKSTCQSPADATKGTKVQRKITKVNNKRTKVSRTISKQLQPVVKPDLAMAPIPPVVVPARLSAVQAVARMSCGVRRRVLKVTTPSKADEAPAADSSPKRRSPKKSLNAPHKATTPEAPATDASPKRRSPKKTSVVITPVSTPVKPPIKIKVKSVRKPKTEPKFPAAKTSLMSDVLSRFVVTKKPTTSGRLVTTLSVSPRVTKASTTSPNISKSNSVAPAAKKRRYNKANANKAIVFATTEPNIRKVTKPATSGRLVTTISVVEQKLNTFLALNKSFTASPVVHQPASKPEVKTETTNSATLQNSSTLASQQLSTLVGKLSSARPNTLLSANASSATTDQPLAGDCSATSKGPLTQPSTPGQQNSPPAPIRYTFGPSFEVVDTTLDNRKIKRPRGRRGGAAGCQSTRIAMIQTPTSACNTFQSQNATAVSRSGDAAIKLPVTSTIGSATVASGFPPSTPAVTKQIGVVVPTTNNAALLVYQNLVHQSQANRLPSSSPTSSYAVTSSTSWGGQAGASAVATSVSGSVGQQYQQPHTVDARVQGPSVYDGRPSTTFTNPQDSRGHQSTGSYSVAQTYEPVQMAGRSQNSYAGMSVSDLQVQYRNRGASERMDSVLPTAVRQSAMVYHSQQLHATPPPAQQQPPCTNTYNSNVQSIREALTRENCADPVSGFQNAPPPPLPPLNHQRQELQGLQQQVQPQQMQNHQSQKNPLPDQRQIQQQVVPQSQIQPQTIPSQAIQPQQLQHQSHHRQKILQQHHQIQTQQRAVPHHQDNQLQSHQIEAQQQQIQQLHHIQSQQLILPQQQVQQQQKNQLRHQLQQLQESQQAAKQNYQPTANSILNSLADELGPFVPNYQVHPGWGGNPSTITTYQPVNRNVDSWGRQTESSPSQPSDASNDSSAPQSLGSDGFQSQIGTPPAVDLSYAYNQANQDTTYAGTKVQTTTAPQQTSSYMTMTAQGQNYPMNLEKCQQQQHLPPPPPAHSQVATTFSGRSQLGSSTLPYGTEYQQRPLCPPLEEIAVTPLSASPKTAQDRVTGLSHSGLPLSNLVRPEAVKTNTKKPTLSAYTCSGGGVPEASARSVRTTDPPASTRSTLQPSASYRPTPQLVASSRPSSQFTTTTTTTTTYGQLQPGTVRPLSGSRPSPQPAHSSRPPSQPAITSANLAAVQSYKDLIVYEQLQKKLENILDYPDPGSHQLMAPTPVMAPPTHYQTFATTPVWNSSMNTQALPPYSTLSSLYGGAAPMLPYQQQHLQHRHHQQTIHGGGDIPLVRVAASVSQSVQSSGRSVPVEEKPTYIPETSGPFYASGRTDGFASVPASFALCRTTTSGGGQAAPTNLSHGIRVTNEHRPSVIASNVRGASTLPEQMYFHLDGVGGAVASGTPVYAHHQMAPPAYDGTNLYANFNQHHLSPNVGALHRHQLMSTLPPKSSERGGQVPFNNTYTQL